MKRLISWLLALTLIFGLVPMSALAVEVDVDGSYDEDVDFGELVKPEVGTQENPEEIIWSMGDNCYVATVTVAANKTHYFYFTNNAQPTMVLTANDEVVSWVPGNPPMGQPSTFCLTNGSDAEVTYALTLGFPAGDMMNPVVIDELTYFGEVSQAAGDFDGYYYTYTATETGTVILYFNAVYDENGDLVENVGIRDITVTNMNTYAQYTLQEDGVDFFGLQLQVPVTAGQELQIITSWVSDAAGNSYPAADYTWTGEFSYPAGSELNPIQIDWNWDENMANGTATVEVAADGTYFWGEAAMILTVDGVETAQENGMFVLNAGTYELALTTPVGQNVNPEVINDINGDFATGSLAEGAEGYYYIWTATEDGTVTLDASEGANIIVTHFGDVVTYTDEEGSFEYVETNTYELATAKMNEETWALEGWDVAENISFEVKAGHSVKIQVVALEVGNWEKPAISYTLTGSFEKAGPAIDANLKFQTIGLSFQDYIGVDFVVTKAAFGAYDNVYIESVQADAVQGDIEETLQGTNLGTAMKRFQKEVLSWSMPEQITVTLYGVKDGVVTQGQTVTTSVEQLALAKIGDYATAGNTKACTALVNMLNYGAAVQAGYSHNASVLPNANLGDYAQYATVEDPAFNATNSSEGTGAIAVRTNSVSMQSKVEIQFAFMNVDVSAYELRYTVNGTQGKIAGSDFAVQGPFKTAKIAVKAADMRSVYTVALYDPATGEPVTAIYTVSVEAYAKGQVGGTYDAVVKALLKYGDSVAALAG